MNDFKNKKSIKVSEIFGTTLQGEGRYTGAPSIWVRTFGCPLRCSGFAQENVNDSTTWIIPYENLDISKIKSINELPVFDKCCDTYYAIDNKFKSLSPVMHIDDIAKQILDLSPDGKLLKLDLCFTGGEPLLWGNELARLAYNFLTHEYGYDNIPNRIQIETNSTKSPTDGLIWLQEYIKDSFSGTILGSNGGICFNISPKLKSVSGEPNGIDYANICLIEDHFPKSSLKFVVNDTDECWRELDNVRHELEQYGVQLPIYIMPVGATKEQQEDSIVLTNIVNKALKRKLHISGRLHCTIFGNTPGT